MSDKPINEMTEEELEEFRKDMSESLLNSMKEHEKRGKKILTVDNELREKAEALFDTCLDKMHGEYQLYTVYNNTNEDTMAVYGLVYAEYYEKDGYNEEAVLKVLKEDGEYLHQKLKESKLPIDYYYIMPYYNPTTGKMAGDSILYNGDILLTNEFDTK